MKKIIAICISVMLVCSCALSCASAKASFSSLKPSVSVSSASYKSIKISWKKVSGAKKYILYRKTSKSGKWKKLTSTTKRKFTNSSLTTGKKYYYRLRASKKNGKKTVYTKYSAVKTATPTLAKPTLSVSLKTGNATLSWKKVSGATGYVIYRTVGKTTSKKATVKTLKYTDKGLKSNTKYSYKIRAIRKSGKKTYVSPYSKTVTCSYKEKTADPIVTVNDDYTNKIDFKGQVFRMSTNQHTMWSNKRFMRMVEKFEKTYNCQILIDDNPFGTYTNTIKSNMARDDGYDIVLLHGSHFIEGVKADLYQPLDNYIKNEDKYSAAKPSLGGIDMERSSYFALDGKTYAVCRHGSVYPYVMFYNKSLFNEEGLKKIESFRNKTDLTWDDVTSLQQYLPDGVKLFSDTFAGRPIGLSYNAPCIMRNSETGKYYDYTSSKPFTDALNLVKHFYDIGCIETRRSRSDNTDSFMSGKVAMYFEESYKVLYLSPGVKASSAFSWNTENLGILRVPMMNTEQAYPTGWLTGVACCKGRNPEVAILWQKFWSTFKTAYPDSNDFDEDNAEYVTELIDKNISFECASVSTSKNSNLQYANDLFLRQTNHDGTVSPNNNLDNIVSCIWATLGY